MAYWHSGWLSKESPESQAREFLLQHLFVPDSGAFSYAVDYSDGDFAIIRVEPRK